MAVTTTKTNKPINPRGNDQSPLKYNRAALYSGKALDFDGVNDDVLSTITISGAKTYCAWINADGTSNERIISISGGGLSNITFSNNKFNMYDGTNIPETTTTFETGQWYFVVGVQEANNAKIYVNGIEQPLSTTNWIERTHTAATIAIGRDAAGASAFYDGKISGVRVFNTALTAAQVSDLYNNPEKIVPTGVSNTALKLWLPMMEGAGTTAYDGSGNGNHGTISGATWTHGIGAPVSQTAMIDWNKGVNLLTESNNFTDSDWSKVYSGVGSTAPSLTANYAEGPSGYSDATRLQATITGTDTGDYSLVQQQYSTTAGTYTSSIYVKSNTASSQTIYFRESSADDTSTFTATTEWTRIEKTDTSSSNWVTIGVRGSATGAASIDILIWGANGEEASTAGPYTPTLSTAQTSPVLLPQGLTSGRDITGVNLFENVRKQGALNLDGNSWAEVHDNASIDLTTSATLECWYKWGTQLNAGLVGRWDYPNNQRSLVLLHGALDNARLLFSFNGTNASALEGTSTPAEGTWVHIVGTYDGTTFKLYVNATQEATASSTGVLYNSPDPLEIGRHGYGAIGELNGSIAQPRIYNRALTAEEVQRNYDAGKNIYTNS